MTGLRLILASLLLLALAAGVSAQNNVIRGKVRTGNGSTVNNAIVELRRAGGGMLGQTVTRNDGDFAFSGLDYAEYEVMVTLSGFEPTLEMVRFKLPPGMATIEVLNVEILLRPKPDVLLAAPGVNFVQEVPRAAKTAYEKGVARIRDGKSAEGLTLLREAITLFPEYFNAHFALGFELYRTGKYDQSIEALEHARKINDRESGVYYLFGLLMVRQQKFAVAEYAFHEATKLNANSPPYLFYRGLTLIELAVRGSDESRRKTDFAEAERVLNRALELTEGKLGPVYLQLYRIHERRGETHAAIRDLENYLKMEPTARDAAAVRSTLTRLRGASR